MDIHLKTKETGWKGCIAAFPSCPALFSVKFCGHFFYFCRQAFPQEHGLAVGKPQQVGEHPKPGLIAQVLCTFCSLTYRSISSRISFDKSILSSSPEYMSDLRRIAWYSPSLLTMPFMTLCMRVSMSWYNAESFPIQSLLTWCRTLTLFWRDSKWENK